MLPFLKPKSHSAGVIIQQRKPDDKDESEMDMGDHAMEAAAEDIMKAINSKDSRHLALALRAAFQILDSEPHEEGPHTKEE